jgi:protein-disulfide isomerase
MAVAPKFSAHLLPLTTITPSSTTVPHTLEFYLDYVCPFSAKQFKTFYTSVVPLIKQKYTNPGVRVIFRQQVQPWHPSSTLVHEAGLAVARTKPDKFWEFSEKLFEKQKEYFDVNVVNELRNDTYKRLANLAGSVDGVDGSQILSMLLVPDKPGEDGSLNIGNKVTNDLKVLIKMGRLASVHVSPTVLFDGVPDNSISSSWTVDQWEEWLEKNLK